MRATLGFICLAFSLSVLAQQRPIEIDPNTKLQVGDAIESEPRLDERSDLGRPEKIDPVKDKPVSAREPQQHEREEGARGGATPLE